MKPENLKCPACSGPMVSRLNSRTQQRFWGCRDFPRCKGTRNTDGEAPRGRSAGCESDEDEDDPDAYWPSDKARGSIF